MKIFNFLRNAKKFFILSHKETIGKKTNYNLFLQFPISRSISKGIFLQDVHPHFPNWIETLKDKKYEKAIILGNAKCLNELTPELLQRFHSENYLSIGLNRSIYLYQTQVLIWSDLLTIRDILKNRAIKSNKTTCLHVRLDRNHKIEAEKDISFQNLHKYWKQHKSFCEWKKNKLFMFRNVLIPALHLCYRLKIKEIILIGFGFDNREYFYNTNNYLGKNEYEIISKTKLDKKCGGYDTQKIVSEVLNHLVIDENIKISYNGDSIFLNNISGLEKITLSDYKI